jgi:hypothetical protein
MALRAFLLSLRRRSRSAPTSVRRNLRWVPIETKDISPPHEALAVIMYEASPRLAYIDRNVSYNKT